MDGASEDRSRVADGRGGREGRPARLRGRGRSRAVGGRRRPVVRRLVGTRRGAGGFALRGDAAPGRAGRRLDGAAGRQRQPDPETGTGRAPRRRGRRNRVRRGPRRRNLVERPEARHLARCRRQDARGPRGRGRAGLGRVRRLRLSGEPGLGEGARAGAGPGAGRPVRRRGWRPCSRPSRGGGVSAADGAGRWTSELSYGFPAFGGRFMATPRAGYGLSGTEREYSLGWGIAPTRHGPDLSIDTSSPHGATTAGRRRRRARGSRSRRGGEGGDQPGVG